MSALVDGETQQLMRQWRADFHRHPELGNAEHRTAARVAQLLRSWGVDVFEGVGGTGVVGVLSRGKGERRMAIRADMDALPIAESPVNPRGSTVPGVMHACGHDGHTSMLLGAARSLALGGGFDGSVVFVFQPDEENGTGALAQLEDGLFERFPVDEVYAMHNLPGMPVGEFATRVGPITASESLFEIHIAAQGGHAALPHLGVDALTVATGVFQALQTIVARKLNPALNGVVSVTEMITDGGRNVLPGTAVLKGDARALTPEIRDRIAEQMRQLVDGVCAAHGVTATVQFDTCFNATINASEPVYAAVAAAGALPGVSMDSDCSPMLFSEDFAAMAAVVPGCYLLMGNGIEGCHAQPLHANDYDFNDEALVVGASLWVQLVRDRLS